MKNLAGLIVCVFITVNSAFSQTIISKWANGKTKEEGTLLDSLPIGKYKYYNENGVLAEEGEYAPATEKNIIIIGNEDGVFDSIAIKKEAIKKYSLQTGKWIYYSSEGIKVQEDIYVPIGIIEVSAAYDAVTEKNIYVYNPVPNPLRTGVCKSYDEKGKLSSEQDCTTSVGLNTEYFENGKIKAQGLFHHTLYKKVGDWKEFDEQGKLIANLKYDAGGNLIK